MNDSIILIAILKMHVINNGATTLLSKILNNVRESANFMTIFEANDID